MVLTRGPCTAPQVTAKVSKTLMDKTIGSGTLSTDYAGQGGQTVTLIDDDGKTVGQVGMTHPVIAVVVLTVAWSVQGAARHTCVCCNVIWLCN